MEELADFIAMANANLANRFSSMERMDAKSNLNRPRNVPDQVRPKPLNRVSPTEFHVPSVEPASEIEDFKPYKRKKKKIRREYGVDFSDMMNQIRQQKRPLDHFTPRTHPPVGVPLKRLRTIDSTNYKPNPRYKNNQDALFDDLKRKLKQEVQMVSPGSIRILQMNLQTFTESKLPYVKQLLKVHHPELLFINEFGVDKECPVFPRIETYYAISYELKSTFSGVAIYVQASLVDSVQLIKSDHPMTMAQICGIQVKNMKFYNVYRSPNMGKSEEKLFCEWIAALDKSDVIVIGDLNLHVSWEDFRAEPGKPGHQNIADEFMEAGFVQYQFGVTYESSGRTLDVTLCNNFETVMSCTTDELFDGQSVAIDHVPTVVDVVLDVDLVEEREVKLWKKRDKEKFATIVRKEIAKLIEYFDEKEIDEITVDELDSRLMPKMKLSQWSRLKPNRCQMAR